MYSKTFLTMCPACTTPERFPRTDLHSIVTCTKCYARFRAEENYVDIEIDERHTSEQMILEETAVHFESPQEKITAEDANKEARGKEQDPSVDWMLVSSKGLQEDISPVNGVIKAFKDSVRVNSFGTREHHKDESLQADMNNTTTEVSSRELRRANEKKKAQGDLKMKKRKHTQSSAAWGIGLRKPFRERRQVKSYSPSRESGLLKRRKLQLRRMNRVGNSGRIAVKSYRRKEVKKRKSDRISDQDVFRDNMKSAGTADTSSKLCSEDYSEEFKSFLKSEIKRQVLVGLGEASARIIKDIEIVEIEEILPESLKVQGATVTDKQEFIAQVKLMTTILFPITLKASEGPPIRSPESPTKSRENSPHAVNCNEAKEGEVKFVEASDLKDVREPEPTKNLETVSLASHTEDEKLSENELSLEDGDVDVPDSEYYDFEFNRSKDRFAPQQVWASYDPGLMPRDYLQIKRVVNIEPFKVLVAVLEPAWLSESGNPLSCGEFSADNRIRIMNEINGFSHLMRWRGDQNGMIHIYPGEEEVWALYKDWKEFSQEKRMRHGYDIVQVASVDRDLAVTVIPLVNHKGSKTVFQKKERQLFQIHKKDFDRFSHQIPTFEIIGYKGVEGCMELDPAAIPFE